MYVCKEVGSEDEKIGFMINFDKLLSNDPKSNTTKKIFVLSFSESN